MLVLLAMALRVPRLDFQPLWWDEGYSIWFANQPVTEILRLTALDIHPPLYYILLGGWSQWFGLSPAALRLFSVLVGVLAIPLIYVVGRRLAGWRSGMLAAILLAISPLHIFYSQEVRMYGLAVTWSLLALGFSARWLEVGTRGRRMVGGGWQVVRRGWLTPASGDPGIGSGLQADGLQLGWLIGYCISAALGLYTLYYAGLLVAAVAVAGLLVLRLNRHGPRRMAWWLGAQGLTLLLYLPWLVYAGPKLVPYVSQKVAADSDRPLGLVHYLARHLAAFAAGHMEGPLAPWWWLGMVGLLPIAIGLWRWRSGRLDKPYRPFWTLVLFLSTILVVLLTLGWLVNLNFPFFPDRGERLLLMGLPVYLLLASAAVLSSSSRFRDPESRILSSNTSFPAFASLLAFLLLAIVSLSAFYTVPRYADEDYRPLVGQVVQWGRPQDTVFAVFPWQVGYFWSYGAPQSEGPQVILSPTNEWGPEAQAALDDALARGHVWFPEHLSLGGIFETAAEQYLSGEAFGLANRWYSPSTRLTGWATRSAIAGPDQWQETGPIAFDRDLLASRARLGPTELVAANDALLLELAWENAATRPARNISLRLVDDLGRAWARQDFTPATPNGPDMIALLIPGGTPPGSYELRLGVSQAAGAPLLDVLDDRSQPQGTEAVLGQVEVTAPETPPPTHVLPAEHTVNANLADRAILLGYSATHGPLIPGGDLDVSLFWQAQPALASSSDLFAFLQLLDDDGQVVAAWEGPPVSWHATSAWQPGELVRSQHTLRLPASLNDGRYQLIAGLFDPDTGQRVEQRTGADAVSLEQVEVRGRHHEMGPPQPQRVLEADLARLGRLVGFDLSSDAVDAGGLMDLTLYWQATETTGDRLAVFVHLLDLDGNFLAQSDAEPGAGDFPTSSWIPGEYLTDSHRLTIRSDAPSGPAILIVGLYDPVNGQRVPWVDSAGTPIGDVLELPVTVEIAES